MRKSLKIFYQKFKNQKVTKSFLFWVVFCTTVTDSYSNSFGNLKYVKRKTLMRQYSKGGLTVLDFQTINRLVYLRVIV